MGQTPSTFNRKEEKRIIRDYHEKESEKFNGMVDKCEEEYEAWKLEEAVKVARQKTKDHMKEINGQWNDALPQTLQQQFSGNSDRIDYCLEANDKHKPLFS